MDSLYTLPSRCSYGSGYTLDTLRTSGALNTLRSGVSRGSRRPSVALYSGPARGTCRALLRDQLPERRALIRLVSSVAAQQRYIEDPPNVTTS